MSKKLLTLAQFKKACQVTPADLKGYCYMDIIDSVTSNAKCCLAQGFISQSVHDKAIDYGVSLANRGSY